MQIWILTDNKGWVEYASSNLGHVMAYFDTTFAEWKRIETGPSAADAYEHMNIWTHKLFRMDVQ